MERLKERRRVDKKNSFSFACERSSFALMSSAVCKRQTKRNKREIRSINIPASVRRQEQVSSDDYKLKINKDVKKKEVKSL